MHARPLSALVSGGGGGGGGGLMPFANSADEALYDLGRGNLNPTSTSGLPVGPQASAATKEP